jgi:hypothetical protein
LTERDEIGKRGDSCETAHTDDCQLVIAQIVHAFCSLDRPQYQAMVMAETRIDEEHALIEIPANEEGMQVA